MNPYVLFGFRDELEKIASEADLLRMGAELGFKGPQLDDYVKQHSHINLSSIPHLSGGYNDNVRVSTGTQASIYGVPGRPVPAGGMDATFIRPRPDATSDGTRIGNAVSGLMPKTTAGKAALGVGGALALGGGIALHRMRQNRMRQQQGVPQ